MPTIEKHEPNVVVGRGRISIAQYIDNVYNPSRRYLGPTSIFTLTVAGDSLQVIDSEGTGDGYILDLTKGNLTGTITLTDVSPDNLALFFGSSPSTTTAPTTAASDTIKAAQDRYFLLGESITYPMGIGSITAASVSVELASDSSTTYTEGEDKDFLIDYEKGTIYIVKPDGKTGVGTIAEDTEIKITYTPTGQSKIVIGSDLNRTQTVRLFYDEDTYTQIASPISYVVTKCTLTPTGDLPVKSTDTLGNYSIPLTFKSITNQEGMDPLYSTQPPY